MVGCGMAGLYQKKCRAGRAGKPEKQADGINKILPASGQRLALAKICKGQNDRQQIK